MNIKLIFFSICFGVTLFMQAQQQKFLIMAKFSDAQLAKQMEQETVNQLKIKGYEALIAHNNFSEDELNNENLFLTKIDELGITGLIAFVNPEINYKTKRTPSVNANVHTKPLKIGMFRVNVGGSVPIAGGTKTKKEVIVSGEFYNEKDNGPLFSKTFKGNQTSDNFSLIKKFAADMIKELSRNNVIK